MAKRNYKSVLNIIDPVCSLALSQPGGVTGGANHFIDSSCECSLSVAFLGTRKRSFLTKETV